MAMTTEGELRAWRTGTRAELLRARAALSPEEHGRKSGEVLSRLLGKFGHLTAGVVGGYSPFRGEIDPGRVLERVFAQGGTVALPVVAGRELPLVFRRWEPGDAMEAGPLGIPQPALDRCVEPDMLLIPLVGFDRDCFRLGYGGGYYDRTLRALAKRPVAVGIGFELARLGTIQPQPYDVPLDFVVTEAGIFRPGAAAPQSKV